jgi:formylglycine-generating enzyme required for sulfatase activity
MGAPDAPLRRIFVSHSHEDNDFGVRPVGGLRAALGGDETAVWYDVSGGLHGGDEWWRKIVAEITARPIFIVILSPAAMASGYVQTEFDLAFKQKHSPAGKQIIPILYQPCQPREDMTLLQMVSFLEPKPYEQALGELLAALGALASASGSSAPSIAAPAPVDSASELVRQMLPQIEASWAAHDWPDVARKCAYLIARAQVAITPKIYRMQAHALMEEGDTAGARTAWDAALALDPTDVPTIHSAARARMDLDQPAEAMPLLEDALALTGNREQRIALLKDIIQAAVAMDKGDVVARHLAEGKRLAPDDPFWATVPGLPLEQFPVRLAQLGFTVRRQSDVTCIIPPLCAVPTREFLLGKAAGDRDYPLHRVFLHAYQIARFPVTVAEYACFVRATGRTTPPGEDGKALQVSWEIQLQERLDHPVVMVSWHDAVAYAQWLAKLTGQPWRLPSAEEWEAAARGTERRRFPWGNTFDQSRCNSKEGGKGSTTPVGSYPTDASPYGVQDMMGNVWEWTSSYGKTFSYWDNSRPKVDSQQRALCGSYFGNEMAGEGAYDYNSHSPEKVSGADGFRLALQLLVS